MPGRDLLAPSSGSGSSGGGGARDLLAPPGGGGGTKKHHHGGGGFWGGIAHGFERLGQEFVGVGPGLYHAGEAFFVKNPEYVWQAVSHGFAPPKGQTADPFSRTIVQPTVQQTLAEVKAFPSHPLRVVEQDPLGTLGLAAAGVGAVGGTAARVAAAADAARAGGTLGEVARAAAAAPKIERTLTLGGEAVHPLPFKSAAGALVQRHVFDAVRQYALDNPDTAVGRVVGPEAQQFYAKVMAEENTVTQRARQVPRARVERFGRSEPLSARGRIPGARRGQLSAAQNTALLMHGFGTPAEHTAYLENAIRLADKRLADLRAGGAKVKAIRAAQTVTQDLRRDLTLTKSASQYLDAKGLVKHPATLDALAVIRSGSEYARDLRVQQGSITSDQALIRLGKQRAEIMHGAAGFKGLSLGEKYVQLRGDVAKASKAARPALKTELATVENQLLELGRQVDQSGGFYVPHEWEGKNQFQRRQAFQPSTADVLRAGPAKERFHEYTGTGLRLGGRRINVPALVGRSMAKPMQIEAIAREHARLWEAAARDRGEIRGPARAIVDTSTVPKEVKALFGREHPGGLTGEEAGQLSETELQTLTDRLYPSEAQAGPDVRWLPERVVKTAVHRYKPVSSGLKTGPTLSQLARLRRYSPAYLRWLPQNLALSLVQQGPLLFRNVALWRRFLENATPEEVAQLETAAGSGYAKALAETGALGRMHAPIQALGAFWHNLNDRFFRTVAFVHEAAREGFNTPEKLRSLLADPESPDYQLVARRAERELIKYTPGAGRASQALGRTLPVAIVSWPWTRGATNYTARFAFEHPLQAGAYGQAGRQGAQTVEDWYKRFGGVPPAYLERYLPTKAGGVDTGWINIADTPGAIAEALSNRDQYRSSVADSLGQAVLANLVLELYQGRDRYGRLTSRQQALLDALRGTVPGMPQLGRKAKKPILKPGEVPALLRLLPYPVAPINYANAAQAGNRDLSGR